MPASNANKITCWQRARFLHLQICCSIWVITWLLKIGQWQPACHPLNYSTQLLYL